MWQTFVFQAQESLSKYFHRKTSTVTSILHEEEGTTLPEFTFCPGFK